MDNDEIVNRVTSSSLISINLEDYYTKGERILFDLKDHLFQGLILKEKNFRESVKNHDWNQYEGKYLAIHCTTDAVIPTWAYMLLASKLTPIAEEVFFGDLKSLDCHLIKTAIDNINTDQFKNAKVVVKGCGSLPITEFAYVEITKKLLLVVSSLMFGEPCSTVPIYKKPREA
ncbi:MAG: DUF2480 family protein [Bacteroidetes bacterium]|nr:DUF2480 family protein [Bacteroidota bacterium]